jgi:hypothetical protein
MKKIIVVVLMACVLVSCGTSKTVRTSKKVIKGQWTLNDISYDNYGSFRITFFNDATKDCLEGSSWNFIPNNNSGNYNVLNDACETGQRNFVFTIEEVDEVTGLYDFLLKPTDSKLKSADNKGFRLKLNRLTDTEMEWIQYASIDGITITITMKFNKTIE